MRSVISSIAKRMESSPCGGAGISRRMQNRSRAEYAKAALKKIPGCRLPHPGPGFNEFVLELPRPASAIHQHLLGKGIVAGLPLEQYFPDRKNDLLIAVTETNSRAQIDRLARELREAL